MRCSCEGSVPSPVMRLRQSDSSDSQILTEKKRKRKRRSSMENVCRKGFVRDERWVRETGDWCEECISCEFVNECEHLEEIAEEEMEEWLKCQGKM